VRLRYLLSRFPAFLDMLLSPLSFFARLVGCPRRLLALNLLPILGNLRCTEAAHLCSYVFFLLCWFLILRSEMASIR
jgi:hypothetical protein